MNMIWSSAGIGGGAHPLKDLAWEVSVLLFCKDIAMVALIWFIWHEDQLLIRTRDIQAAA
jgi:hypothetical protein